MNCQPPCMGAAVLWIIARVCITASAETYYVNPSSSNTTCPEEGVPCYTLSQYASKPNDYFASNTSLILLPANHSLDSELRINNITFLSVSVANETFPTDTMVTCSPAGKFWFGSVEDVHVRDLVFSGCVNNIITSVIEFTLEDCTLLGRPQIRTGLMMISVSSASIVWSTFHSFTSDIGGAILVNNSSVFITSSVFQRNQAKQAGGSVSVLFTNITIQNSSFLNNTVIEVHGKGGAINAYFSNITVQDSVFISNNVSFIDLLDFSQGGAVCVSESTVTMYNATFCGNVAPIGGAFLAYDSVSSIHDSTFMKNVAYHGGAIYIASGSKLSTTGFLDVQNDQSYSSAVFSHSSFIVFAGNMTMSNNSGGLCAFSSDITISGVANIGFSLGGGITCVASNITLVGITKLMHNSGVIIGGAILASDCKVHSYGETTIAHNTASSSGGGIAAYQSELNFWGRTNITGNTVSENGGGIIAVGSTINVYGGVLHVSENSAKNGSGLYLDLTAKMFVKKTNIEYLLTNGTANREDWIRIEFTDNSAEYGGAIFVNDINSGVCKHTDSTLISTVTETECFFQSIYLYNLFSLLSNDADGLTIQHLSNINVRNLYFSNNTASKAGGILYGGLLDRCTLNTFSEVITVIRPYQSRLEIVSLLIHPNEDLKSTDVISSDPVRVAFCNNGQVDHMNHHTLHVRKGETFTLSVMAVDQTRNPVPATIRSYLDSESGELGQGQASQNSNETCLGLKYNVVSPKNSEKLIVYADGPCNAIGQSKLSINIQFEPCPIGFEESLKDGCVCNTCLSSFTSNCSIDKESVLRKKAVWIAVDNSSGQFLTHTNCPFDYCRSEEVYVNLNVPNGSDAQCDFNRSGILCGSCKDNFSLSLGNSHCIICSNNNPLALLIFFAIAGVALVVFLLVFNLTVAVGTINGLIFYANIIATNRATFFPFDKPNVFIAWLNLDFGIPTCFYKGMDRYEEVWLQFVFPTYILLLVVMVIIVARYSQCFAKLISNRNPVATLATLILLSYAKLLRTIVAALLPTKYKLVYVTDKCENTTSRLLWLVDGNINYLQGKHIPLFLVALFVLLLGLVYVILLSFWQCFRRYLSKLRLQLIRKVVMRLNVFTDVYHAPYNTQHCYWTGLLLFVRVVLFCVPAFMNSSDPKTSLMAITCVSGGLLLYKEIVREKIYKNIVLNALESSFIFNLVVFATATLYVRETEGNQAAVAKTSTSIAFLTFIVIFVYHAFISFKSLSHLLDKVKKNALVFLNERKEKTSNHELQQVTTKEFEESKEFSQFREPMLEDNSISKECDIVEHHRPQQSVQSQGVTHTVIDGIPSRPN